MPRTARRILFALLVPTFATLLAPGPAPAATGLPVPRFAALRAQEVNMRTGPGVRYPVEWVFTRRNLPVEITAEFEAWRKIRDWQGAEGWVHTSMLTGKRSVIITGRTQPLRRSDSTSARVIARVEKTVVGRLLTCRGAWCRLEIAGLRGWMQRSQFWGVYPKEKVK